MPAAFGKDEETRIRDRLRSEGRKLFATQGVQKTSIEQITSATGIAKGSFYKFYRSKELLFFELLEASQNTIRNPLLRPRPSGEQSTRAHFERGVHQLFVQVCADPLVMFMGRETELLALSRKVPAAILSAHQKQDQDFLDALILHWNTKAEPPARDQIAARMTNLLLIGLKRDFFGTRLFPLAVNAAVTSLADCLFVAPLDIT